MVDKKGLNMTIDMVALYELYSSLSASAPS